VAPSSRIRTQAVGDPLFVRVLDPEVDGRCVEVLAGERLVLSVRGGPTPPGAGSV
jgi:hypothetical protein